MMGKLDTDNEGKPPLLEEFSPYHIERIRSQTRGAHAFGDLGVKEIEAAIAAKQLDLTGETAAVTSKVADVLNLEICCARQDLERREANMTGRINAEKVDFLFTEALEDASLSEKIRAEVCDGKSPTLAAVEEAFVNGSLSPVLYYHILAHHRNKYQEKVREKEQLLPKVVNEFRGVVSDRIRSGDFPLSHELMEKRLDHMKVYFSDIIGSSGRSEGSSSGHMVTLCAYSEPEKFKHEAFHEFLHIISGRRLRWPSTEATSFEIERVGVAEQSPTSSGTSGAVQARRKNWLNEAITENLNLELLTSTGADARAHATYSEHRGFLRQMTGEGVPRKLLLQAYFEDCDPQRGIESEVHNQQLEAVIAQRMGPTFLEQMERHPFYTSQN